MNKHVIMLFSMSFEPYQGRYQRAFNEAKALVDAGYKVTVLAWDRSGKSKPFEIRNEIRIHRVSVSAPEKTSLRTIPNFFLLCFKILIKSRSLKADIIHCHNLQLLPLGLCLAVIKNVPLVFDSCEPDYFALYPGFLQNPVCRVERFLVKRTQAVIVHNYYQLKKYGSLQKPVPRLIGSYPSLRQMSRKPIDTGKEQKIVLGRIGSIYENNGIEEIMKAFEIASGRNDKLELLLAGRVFDHYRSTFDNLVKGSAHRVNVTGPFDSKDIASLYDKIDISIMIYRRTKWFENITPTKFFDSLAMGVPVIASDMGGLKDIVDTYQCGLVVNEQDSVAVADAIETIAKNPFLRKQMSVNGIKAVRKYYNWELMEKRLLKVYKEIIQ